jgi:hypothetical protein
LVWSDPRTEIISVDTDRLARHAFTQMGLVCLISETVDGGILLTTRSEWRTDDLDGHQWFRSRQDADAVINKMVTREGMFWKARRVDGGVLLDIPIDRDVADVVEECLRWSGYRSHSLPLGHRVVTSDEVNAQIASIKVQMDRALVRMQTTGGMKLLNKRYKALRTAPRAEGEKFQSFKVWMTAELERLILLPETLAAIMLPFEQEEALAL